MAHEDSLETGKCAHQVVRYNSATLGEQNVDRWQCEECGTDFIPRIYLTPASIQDLYVGLVNKLVDNLENNKVVEIPVSQASKGRVKWNTLKSSVEKTLRANRVGVNRDSTVGFVDSGNLHPQSPE